MTPIGLNQYLKKIAAGVGFDRCRVAEAQPIGREDYLQKWLRQGMAGSMSYLARNVRSRLDPAALLPGARSAVVVALLYHQGRPAVRPADLRGRVAMYAWGEDYHEVVKAKLLDMKRRMIQDLAPPFEARVCVDTSAILEREIAAGAGMGWIGKNTLVLDAELGSYFFLGVMLTTLDVAPDEPVSDHCGTCTACLEACPTQALIAPYQMDASRCISYLTIEHRGDISKPFQEMMGDWLFGCDVCQDVCPHNRKAPHTSEPRFAIRDPGPAPRLSDIASWTEDDYRSMVKDSPLSRARLDMLKRNAQIVKANLKRQTSPSPCS